MHGIGQRKTAFGYWNWELETILLMDVQCWYNVMTPHDSALHKGSCHFVVFFWKTIAKVCKKSPSSKVTLWLDIFNACIRKNIIPPSCSSINVVYPKVLLTSGFLASNVAFSSGNHSIIATISFNFPQFSLQNTY